MKKEVTTITAGIFIGATLASPTAAAVSELLTAQRVSYPIYVDGRSVDLDAYAIEGHTYVQLRDIGKTVGFNVYWDGAVQVQSGVTYTGEAPPAVDYSAQANPAIFTGAYTRELYNTFREAILTGKSGVYDRERIPDELVWKVEAAATTYSNFQVQHEDSGLALLYIREPLESHIKVNTILQPFLQSLTDKSDYEKLYAAACLICEKLDYESKKATAPAVASPLGALQQRH